MVKWFVAEADSDRAISLRDRYVNGEVRLAAPSLLTFEVLNAVRDSNLYTVVELRRMSTTLGGYGLALYGLEGEYAALAIEAAEANDLTVYDSSYVGLALWLGARFLTADKKLIKKLKGKYASQTSHISGEKV